MGTIVDSGRCTRCFELLGQEGSLSSERVSWLSCWVLLAGSAGCCATEWGCCESVLKHQTSSMQQETEPVAAAARETHLAPAPEIAEFEVAEPSLQTAPAQLGAAHETPGDRAALQACFTAWQDNLESAVRSIAGLPLPLRVAPHRLTAPTGAGLALL